MNNDDDMPTTCLTQITEVLEKHNEILAEHRKYLERLFEEVTAVKKKIESLEAEKSLDSSDVEFLKTVTTRLQAIATSIEAQR
jgi:uncharacterized coiled-coil protein SlyX